MSADPTSITASAGRLVRLALADVLRDLRATVERADMDRRRWLPDDPTTERAADRDAAVYRALDLALVFAEGRTRGPLADDRAADRRREEAATLGDRVQCSLDLENHGDWYHHFDADDRLRAVKARAAAATERAHLARGRAIRARQPHTPTRSTQQHARTDRAARSPVARDDREGVGDRGR